MTGFSPMVRRIITERADRWCEVCGLRMGVELHHRRPRGMGGTRRASTNSVSAGLLVCSDCHRRIESQRADAISNGWLVTQTEEPTDIPVLYRGTWVRLDDLGNLHDYGATA